MCVDLILLTGGASLDVSADEGGEARPPKFSGNQLASFQETGVAGGFMIVAAHENGAAKGVVSGDIDATFIGEDASFHLPICEPRAKGEGNVLVHGLESLEDKGVTRGCGFNAMGECSVNQVDKKRWREEGNIGIVGVIRGEEVWVVGKGVGAGEELSGDVDHFEVKVGKVNKPARLAAVERLGLTEVGEILMICEHLHRKGGAVEVVAPRFKGTDYC